MSKHHKLRRKPKIRNTELWNLDYTIASWIVPRLKQFKKINIAYPGRPPMDTPEKWDEALDKMILAFETARKDPVDLYGDYITTDFERYKKLSEEWHKTVEEGLKLFSEYFLDLWI